MTSTILFVGDSITDADRRATADGLGDGYVREVARTLAGDDVRIVNRGVSGDRLVDLERRWQTDVLDHRPDLLTVFVGINDTWRRYDSDDPTSAEDFAARYRSLLQRSVDAGIGRLILVEPFLLPVRPEQETWRDDLAPKQASVAELARAFDAALVPLQSLLDAAAAESGPAAIAGDGIHPSPVGTQVIARAWLAAHADSR